MPDLIPERQELPPESDASGTAFDPSRPNVARLYDYLLGGKDNFAADRAAGDQIITALPEVQVGVQAQRAVLGRVVRYPCSSRTSSLDAFGTPSPYYRTRRTSPSTSGTR